jgi:predicted RND superfamily exporter protein
VRPRGRSPAGTHGWNATADVSPRTRRIRRVVAILAAAVVLAVGLAVGASRITTDATTASLLPGNDPAQRATTEAAEYFGSDPLVVLLESEEDGGLLTGAAATRLAGLEGELAALDDVAVVYGPGTVLNQVAATAQNLLASISGRRDLLENQARERAEQDGLTAAQEQAAVDEALAGFDLRYGSLLVRGLPAGLPTLSNDNFVTSVVLEDGQPRSQWRFVVPAPNAVAILVRPRAGLDQAENEDLVAAVEATVSRASADEALGSPEVTLSGLPTVAADLGRTVRQEIPLLGLLGLGSIALCYLLVPWVRRRWQRLLPIAATVAATATTLAAFGWLNRPLSLGVVAFLPILVGTGSDFPAYLVWGADRRSVLTAALAGACGFLALALSPVPFVRDLGIALAIGVVVACIAALLLAKAFGLRPEKSTTSPAPAPGASDAAYDGSRRAPAIAVLAVAAIVGGFGWVALSSLEIESRPDRLAAGLSSLEDAQHVEDVLGSAGEVLIDVRSDSDVLAPETYEWMRMAQQVVVRDFGDRLRPVVSAPGLLAFLGTEPTPEQIVAGVEQLPAYLSDAVLRPDRREAVLSFGIGLDDVAAQDAMFRELRAALPPPPEGVRVQLAGLPVVTARGYELASDDRYLAGLAGIVAATVVLLIGLRRRSDALRALMAALLATGWSLAGAALLGISLTPLTLALGSLATATACEFTVLLAAAPPRRARIPVGLGRSVLVAATAATAGYLTLAASRLDVIRDFGLFLGATVVLSLLAANLVLRAFPPQSQRPTNDGGARRAGDAEKHDSTGDRPDPGSPTRSEVSTRDKEVVR